MSLIAFTKLAAAESPSILRFCENIWLDKHGDCVTVLETVVVNGELHRPVHGIKLYISGRVEGLETCNDLYDNNSYCNWYYSRKGFQQISVSPKVVRGDDTEFQVVNAKIESHYIEERDMTLVMLVFDPVMTHERAGIMLRFRQKSYARRYSHQWTVDERIYDRKSLRSHNIGIDRHIVETEVLAFGNSYVWVILPTKKIVGTVAPSPRNLRHMEEDGLPMLGNNQQDWGLRMMIHWRVDATTAAWDAKRLSAIYSDQPLPYWMTWGGFALAVVGIVLGLLALN